MPELFKDMGYPTIGLAANINIGSEIGFDRGFDRFRRYPQGSAKTLHRKVRRWHDEMKSVGPFLLYLHFNDVHQPYVAHAQYYQEQEDELEDSRARYLSELRYVDEYIATIYELLDLEDNTLLVLVTDHGEEFEDHGDTHHRRGLYRELNETVIMVHGPALGIEARRIPHNVSIVDVLPTVLSLIGSAPPEEAQGLSLAPLIRGTDDAPALVAALEDRVLYCHRQGPDLEECWAAINGKHKLIATDGKRFELYDHTNDRLELNNLYKSGNSIAQSLEPGLKKVMAAGIQDRAEPTLVEVTDELEERLTAIGYVQ